ncbi:hypothetical protein [Flavobacterium fluviatile]|uniref:hypothetical protein n=1 Tax=Flavobacterium fluviatile TaxID=1862387 RepID=UPI001FCB3432|nr:hypothetical protein [Flavobacterium fluviatile]
MSIWEQYKNSDWAEPFLMGSVFLFAGISVVLYLLIIKSRNRKIKQEKLRNEYEQIIVELMYSVVFMDAPFSSVKDDPNYVMFLKNAYFREVLSESVINLHKNYDGVYALKLEQFYKESELIKSSLKKLKSHKWEVKCKGITELAEMNITDASEKMISISKSKNKVLKITAINASIRLEGVKGIIHLTEHAYPIDDWTQLNIINAFKKHDIGDTQGVEYLLESKNTTVVALALKLIKELKLTQKLHHVKLLTERAPNTLIQYEAQSVLKALTVNLTNE